MVSIIIPCFNGYKYMRNCLMSLEKQTEKDFEVIIVDDCSSDDSYIRLKEYEKNTKLQMKIIQNQKNFGPGKSREIGFLNSKGDYIAFCDCDDWYEDIFLEKMTCLLNKNNAEVVFCNHYSVSDDNKALVHSVDKMIERNSKSEMLALAPMSLCRLLVKREMLEKVTFSDFYYGEDGLVVLQIILMAKNIIVTKEGYYNYYLRTNSASLNPSKRAFRDNVEGFEFIKERLKSYEESCEFIGIKNVIYAATLVGFKAGIPMKEIKKVVKDFRKEFQNFNKNIFLKELGVSKRIYVLFMYYGLYQLCRGMSYIHRFLHFY